MSALSPNATVEQFLYCWTPQGLVAGFGFRATSPGLAKQDLPTLEKVAGARPSGDKAMLRALLGDGRAVVARKVATEAGQRYVVHGLVGPAELLSPELAAGLGRWRGWREADTLEPDDKRLPTIAASALHEAADAAAPAPGSLGSSLVEKIHQLYTFGDTTSTGTLDEALQLVLAASSVLATRHRTNLEFTVGDRKRFLGGRLVLDKHGDGALAVLDVELLLRACTESLYLKVADAYDAGMLELRSAARLLTGQEPFGVLAQAAPMADAPLELLLREPAFVACTFKAATSATETSALEFAKRLTRLRLGPFRDPAAVTASAVEAAQRALTDEAHGALVLSCLVLAAATNQQLAVPGTEPPALSLPDWVVRLVDRIAYRSDEPIGMPGTVLPVVSSFVRLDTDVELAASMAEHPADHADALRDDPEELVHKLHALTTDEVTFPAAVELLGAVAPHDEDDDEATAEDLYLFAASQRLAPAFLRWLIVDQKVDLGALVGGDISQRELVEPAIGDIPALVELLYPERSRWPLRRKIAGAWS